MEGTGSLCEQLSAPPRKPCTSYKVVSLAVSTFENRSFVRLFEFFLLTLRINPSPGKYYSCEDGSEPDVDAFRAQANIHERKCTSGKQAVQLPLLVDPCIDAEAAPLEYSYNNEWMFCLGDAERDATHSPDGDVDCGKKIKATQSLFTDRF